MSHIIVKFREGTQIRLRSNRLVALTRTQRENSRLEAFGLEESEVELDLRAVQEIVGRSPDAKRLRRLFTIEESQLAKLRSDGEARSHRELADLDLYYRIDLRPGATAQRAARIVDALNALPSIEIAYIPSPVRRAAVDIPPITPSFETQQVYLDPASVGGIDAHYAWTLPGGKGQGVKVVDVEKHWRPSHEDLPTLFYQGDSGGTQADENHGTAVLGILTAAANGYGVTGIAHQSQVGAQGIGDGVADAILQAGLAAGAGGIVLIELEAITGYTCGCLSLCAFPVEKDSAERDAIINLVELGVVVVEPAGNGGRLISTEVDSGAIMVGASESGTNRHKTCFSNYGSRVDVHSWGWNVVTLGYGNLLGGTDRNQHYTNSFQGTSSASAIVAGAAAVAQGVSLAHGLGALDSRKMRNLLRNTGVPSTDAIGAQPNLKRALDDYLSPPTADFTSSCSGRTCTFSCLPASTDNYGVQWCTWWFGDGTSATTTALNHTYPRSGIWYVRLKVTDYAGRSSQITKAVTVN